MSKHPDSPEDPSKETEQKPASWWPRLLVGLIVICGFGAAWYLFGEHLSLDALASREEQLRDFQQENPLLTFAIAFGIYVAVTGFSLPGATGMTLVYAWLFGFWPALVLVSFASTLGATMAFLLSRYLIGDSIQRRFGDRLATFNRSLEQEGPVFLFMLRLIPLVPFFVINVVMGLTRIRVSTFWWISQVGMLPGTAVYVFAGSSVPSLKTFAEQGVAGIFTWKLWVAFILLGVTPLALKYFVKYVRGKNVISDVSGDTK